MGRLPKFSLATGRALDAHLIIGLWHGNSALGSSLDEAFLDQIGLVDLFDRSGIFSHRDREGTESDGAALETNDKRFEESFIHFVQAVSVDVEHFESFVGNYLGDEAVGFDLRIVADPAQKIVCYPRRPSGARGDLVGAALIDADADQPGAALDDVAQVLQSVVVEAAVHSETRAKRCADQARSSCCTDHRELWQIDPHASRIGALVDNDIQAKIFHRRVEIFFDGGLQPVDLIDKENISAFQSRQDTGQISGSFDHWTAGGLDIDFHGIGQDIGDSCLSQSGRTAEQDMFEHVAALFGGLHHQFQPLANANLSLELAEKRRTHCFQAEDGIRDSDVTGVQTCALPILFFFQAEDGIRDSEVTGVQTCALPI